MRAPAGGLGGMQPQDAQGDRQATAAFQHADQIGIGEVVIGLGIAGQAEIAVQHAGQNGAAAFEVPGVGRWISGRRLHRGAGDRGQALGGCPPVGVGGVHARELQRHGGDVEFGIGQATGGGDRGAGLILAGLRHGPSVAAAHAVGKASVRRWIPLASNQVCVTMQPQRRLAGDAQENT